MNNISNDVLICGFPLVLTSILTVSIVLYKIKKDTRRNPRIALIVALISLIFLCVVSAVLVFIRKFHVGYIVTAAAFSIPLSAVAVLLMGVFKVITLNKKSNSRILWVFATVASFATLVFCMGVYLITFYVLI